MSRSASSSTKANLARRYAFTMVRPGRPITVQKMIETKAPGASVVRFTRYKMGDGLEKKVNDLAAEVAEQTRMKA